MRHRIKKHLHFNGKDKAHRKSVVRNLVTALFEHGGITTTKKRAEAIIPVVDTLVTIAKSEHTDYNKIRLITPNVFSQKAGKAALEFGKKTKNTSGNTRITPIKNRDGDGAILVKIELI
ncbi:hypothetical protein CSB09_03755 [Candidatus Gracilibacteria bacterium]|nr:MAG: hypothetical protein CSB09_03755 [Candidatus Gracilibacteria bacterium]